MRPLERRRISRAFRNIASPLEASSGYSAREETVLAAEELRYAAQAIARVTGRIEVENVLDIVFSELCIGKQGERTREEDHRIVAEEGDIILNSSTLRSSSSNPLVSPGFEGIGAQLRQVPLEGSWTGVDNAGTYCELWEGMGS